MPPGIHPAPLRRPRGLGLAWGVLRRMRSAAGERAGRRGEALPAGRGGAGGARRGHNRAGRRRPTGGRTHPDGRDPARRALEGDSQTLIRRAPAVRLVRPRGRSGGAGASRRPAGGGAAALVGRPVPQALPGMSDRGRVGVLVSGAGTNLQAILDTLHGREGIEVVGVASNRPGAPALARAERAGVPTAVFEGPGYADRAARDVAIADWLRERGAGQVALAGYMQLLSPRFLARFPGAVINVHPALLPAFPGLDAIGQALSYGVKVFGVTVHLVDEGVDSGPIILQRAVELPDARGPEEVRERLRPIEHELLAEGIRLLARGALSLDPGNPRRVVIRD